MIRQYICIEFHCENIVSNKGNRCRKCSGKIHSLKMTGDGNSNFRDAKIQITCNICGKKYADYENYLNRKQNNFCSNECKFEYMSKNMRGVKKPEHSKIMQGLKNPAKRIEVKRKISLAGGGTGIPYENSEYPIEFNDILKEKIRKRDNYQCQNKDCNITEEKHLIVYGQVLCIHHIDYNKQNCKENNLTTLCNNCHLKTNHNRNYWINYFKKIDIRELILQ